MTMTMSMHGITEARYLTEDTSVDAPVTVICRGRVQTRYANDDVSGGGMLAFLQEGGVILPYEPPTPTIPDSVTPYQARVALHTAGYIDAVEAFMASPDAPAEAKIAWEYALVFERQSAFIQSLAPLLGLTEQQIDDLFILAATI